ncbi:hypothetical protein Ciccas_006629 [Cichlidogyrus casuarinus]|uniref:alanine--tRNA ligase n=1 Tax=Cichlidogyrus casuarinus TaxID=1844966 RepID=A0ABD2Q5A0_9PLAT
MTKDEIAQTEESAKTLIAAGGDVFAEDTPLGTAKSIQGLRAVFGEVYPDPVRVVSIGIDVKDLVADPMSPAGSKTSVEFCGGTHVRNAKHIGEFVIVSEEAIAKGIRRIIAVTGHEAERAVKIATQLEQEMEMLLGRSGSIQTVEEAKRLSSELLEALDKVNQAPIGYCKRDMMRTSLSEARKIADTKIREEKQAQGNKILDEARSLCLASGLKNGADICEASNKTTEESWLVYRFSTPCSDSKTVNTALKELEKSFPERALMVVASDEAKVLCMCLVPQSLNALGLKANEWVKSVQELIDAKGGGKPTAAQAIGSKLTGIEVLLKKAADYAKTSLK